MEKVNIIDFKVIFVILSHFILKSHNDFYMSDLHGSMSELGV